MVGPTEHHSSAYLTYLQRLTRHSAALRPQRTPSIQTLDCAIPYCSWSTESWCYFSATCRSDLQVYALCCWEPRMGRQHYGGFDRLRDWNLMRMRRQECDPKLRRRPSSSKTAEYNEVTTYIPQARMRWTSRFP